MNNQASCTNDNMFILLCHRAYLSNANAVNRWLTWLFTRKSSYRFCKYAKVALSLLAVSPGLLVFLEPKPQYQTNVSRDLWVVIKIKLLLTGVLRRQKQNLCWTFVLVWLFWTFLCQGREIHHTNTMPRQVTIIEIIIITITKNMQTKPILSSTGKTPKKEWSVELDLQLTGQVDSGLVKLQGWTKVGVKAILHVSVFYNWSSKKHCYPFKDALLFPPPPPNTMSKLRINFQHCIWGTVEREGTCRQVKFYSHTTVCLACVEKHQKFIHNCSFLGKTKRYVTRYTRHPESAESSCITILLRKYYLHKQIHCLPAMFPSRFKVWRVQKIISRDSVISYSFVSTHHPDNNIRHAVLRLLIKFKEHFSLND